MSSRSYILGFVIALFLGQASAGTEILNIYNWTAYTPTKVITAFEKETGIKVQYSTYSNLEELYTKLKATPNHSYDIIVPSSEMIEKMSQEHLLTRLDPIKIHGLEHLNPDLIHQHFDPQNQYSIPYLWGTTSIVVNKNYFDPATITSWRSLWENRFENKLLLLNSAREVFNVAFLALGYSISTQNPVEIKAAYEYLLKLLPNIKLFNSESMRMVYMDEEATIGIAWSGDAYQAALKNRALTYVYPKEGPSLWIDSLAVPKGAPHLENAYAFINFILRPNIAAQIAEEVSYSTPNLQAIALLPENMRKSSILYPSHDILKKAQLVNDVGEARSLYQKYWLLLRISS
jgi:spermidine/putrescine transport system substrate-binding protein